MASVALLAWRFVGIAAPHAWVGATNGTPTGRPPAGADAATRPRARPRTGPTRAGSAPTAPATAPEERATGAAGRAGRLQLLGGFALVHEGMVVELARTEQRLVAFLALQRRPQPRGRVAEALWPRGGEAATSARLRSALWRLRRATTVVVGDADWLALADEVEVDVARVERRARRLVHAGRPGADPVDDDLGHAALADLGDDLLPDWELDWVGRERERVRQLCLHALEAAADELARRRRFAEAVEAAHAAIRLDDLREGAQRALIRVHVAEGNYGEALAQYRRFRDHLRDELGLAPSPLLDDLVATVPSA